MHTLQLKIPRQAPAEFHEALNTFLPSPILNPRLPVKRDVKGLLFGHVFRLRGTQTQ